MISVVIPECQDTVYLRRCLNAIRRQTCQDYEIIAVGNTYPQEIIEEYRLKVIESSSADERWEGVNRALAAARGESVFFCSMTSVPAANTLHVLAEKCSSENPVSAGRNLIREKNTFKESEKSILSIYGKLWSREFLAANHITFIADCSFAETLFVLEALQYTEEAVPFEDEVYIYETNPQIFAAEEPGTDEAAAFDKLLTLSAPKAVPAKIVEQKIFDILQKSEELSLQKHFVMAIAKGKTDAFELNYRIAKAYISEWLLSCEKEEEEDGYSYIKEYLSVFEENEDFMKILLQLLGLNQEQYMCMKKYDKNEFLFFKDKLVSEKELDASAGESIWVQKYMELEEKNRAMLGALDGKVGLCLKAIGSLPDKQQPAAGNQSVLLTGPELADYVVTSCRQGGLGIKTLVKALGAWMRCKFSTKE